ncbi:hypothetical protein [Variovorax sp. B2]|uniref:hypothetical protein n=1 Tax=Variovorax sp. B2 TaxID=2021406 RepID=UPI0015E130E8|nr:hypothetical protein [Variovorax sp. B2]
MDVDFATLCYRRAIGLPVVGRGPTRCVQEFWKPAHGGSERNKEGRGTVGFIKKLLSSAGEKAAIGDAEKVLAVVRSLGPRELGDLRAAATMALAFMAIDGKSEGDPTFATALKHMQSRQNVPSAVSGRISMLSMRMQHLQKQANASTSPLNQRIASGMPIWIMSLRALTCVAVLPHARQMWALLELGDASTASDILDAATAQLTGHPLTDAISALRDLGTPEIFVPV